MVYIFENGKQFFEFEHLILKSTAKMSPRPCQDYTRTMLGRSRDTVET
jgi:hypothetical protein